LIDSAVPRPPRTGWDKVQHRISELRRFSWTDRRIWLTEQFSRRLHLVKDGTPELNEAETLMDLPAIQLLLEQARDWQPTPYHGKVYLIRGNRNLRGYPNPAGTYGWGEHCTDLDVLSLACNHSQMLVEPYVVRIADEIQSIVSAARAPTVLWPNGRQSSLLQD
jgi:thioesterase domain-containing protein